MRKYARSRSQLALSVMLYCLGIIMTTVGCAGLDYFGGSRQSAKLWAEARGFAELEIKAGAFDLIAFIRRPATPVATMTIYIEGDGAAWSTPYHPPRDPTPRSPIPLALASADPAPAVAYLGRPCQYLEAQSLEQCSSSYWVEKRFAPEIIEAIDAAVTKLKTLFGAQRVRLVGYSGGGVVAALLALRRPDVTALITVSSPLAVTEWTRMKGLSSLTGSLDPLHETGRLPPATHWIGTDDDIVPVSIVELFAISQGGHVQKIKGYDHECCWTRNWLQLLKESP